MINIARLDQANHGILDASSPSIDNHFSFMSEEPAEIQSVLLATMPVPAWLTQNAARSFSDHSPASRHHRLKIVLTLGCAVLLLAAVSVVFWYQDGRYSLPTPRPPTLAAVSVGDTVNLPTLPNTAASTDDRPLLLHFVNPDCPCSRFNADHVRALRNRFGANVRFVAVIQSLGEQNESHLRESLAAAARLFGPEMEAAVDSDGKIAAACGVYSTPQAAILAPGAHQVLLFRGNYNVSRYCADPQTEFVRLALTALVGHQPLPAQSRAAMVAYGCELPTNLAVWKRLQSGSKL